MTIHAASKKRPPAAARAPRAAATLPMPDVLYKANTEGDVVTVPARKVLSFEGAGPPEGAPFEAAVGAIYGVAYTLKFARKRAGGSELKIGPLEGRWWADVAGETLVRPARESWRWRLRIAMPDDATDEEVARAIATATARKGGKLEHSPDAARVRLESIPAQTLGRALHVGPYAEEARTFARIDAAVRAAGLIPARSHLEVYLSDPRRTAPERLKTVLLREIAAPRPVN